jgi:hypothetical protein
MSRYIHFTKLKHLIFPNGGSTVELPSKGSNRYSMFKAFVYLRNWPVRYPAMANEK